MFYFFSKTFDILLMPLSVAVMALVYSLFTKNALSKKRTTIAVILFLLVFSNPIIVNKLLIWWELKPPKNIATHTVGVVLTGGMTHAYDPTSKHVWLGNEADRMAQAFQLYKEGKIKKILISGGVGKLTKVDTLSMEAKNVKHYLTVCGIPETDIILETQARNTRENALFSAKILRNQFHTSTCILITSAFHMRRAVGCFKKVGISATPYPAQYHQRNIIVWFDQMFPSEEALHNLYTIWHEIVGYTVYKMVGYV